MKFQILMKLQYNLKLLIVCRKLADYCFYINVLKCVCICVCVCVCVCMCVCVCIYIHHNIVMCVLLFTWYMLRILLFVCYILYSEDYLS